MLTFFSTKRIVALLAAMVLLAAFAAQGLAAKKLTVYNYMGKPAKYVFLFIGDGMGMPQRSAAEEYAGKQLVMNSLEAQGITSTFAADRFITGSAASATAMAAGQKTNIGMIGMAPDGTKVKTVAELAKEKGMKVGVVSSVSIDHATPAAFYAHVPKRSMYHEIDHALAESGFDFFGGGGLKDPAGKRVLKKNPNAKTLGDAIAKAKDNGFKIVTAKDEFMALSPADGKILAYNDWLQDSGALPYDMDNRAQDITLPEFTGKAIEMLDNDKGFFLMVEGGKIDWACHANDAVASIKDTLAFDDSIAKAVAFAEKHPDETLIVVSGDHECGGLTLGFSGTQYEMNMETLKSQYVSFQRFTDEFLSLYLKECKAAENCSFDNFKPSISFYFGLNFNGEGPMAVQPYQEEMMAKAFDMTLAGEEVAAKDPESKVLYGGYDPLTVSVTHVLNSMAGLGWTSFSHTGVPVATSAMGLGAETFNGSYDNTDIAKKIMAVMGVKPVVHAMDDEGVSVRVASN